MGMNMAKMSEMEEASAKRGNIKMKHLCVYTKLEIFKHKRYDGYLYWEFASRPKILDEFKDGRELRIYFAFNGKIRGYFLIEDEPQLGTVEWFGDTWVEIAPIDQKPFQGFKYLEIK